jgi:hypothetical protein
MTLFKRYLPYLLILLPVISFFGLFFRYTVNAPVNDDYPAVLQFLNNYVTTNSIHEKFKLIFAQHNEHRIVFSRIWTLISYKLQKNVNFNFLSFIGDLSIVGIALVFFRKFLDLKKSLFLFVPVAVLLFNITSWENMTFPMCALSNFVVHLFILLSLLFLAAPTAGNYRNVLLAFFFFFAALMSQGAGLSLLPVSIGILLYKKEYRNLLLYGGLSLLLLLLYFHHYHRPPQSGDLANVLRDLKVRSLLFVFAFLGNAFDYYLIHTNEIPESIGLTSVIGSFFFLLFLYITWQKYYRKNLFNYSIMLLVILTAALAAVSRSAMGLEMAGASRYRINGIIFFISLYFWFIETYTVETKTALAAILVFSGLYFLVINLNQYEFLSVRQEQLYLEALCYQTGDSSIVYPNSEDVARQRTIMKLSEKLNIYHPPSDETIDAYIPHSVRQTGDDEVKVSPLEMTRSIHSIHKIGNDYLIAGFTFLEGKSTNHQKVFIGIRNKTDSTPVYFTAGQVPRFDLNPYFHQFNLKNGGFRARIPAEDIKAGENTVWIKVEVADQEKAIETDNKFVK